LHRILTDLLQESVPRHIMNFMCRPNDLLSHVFILKAHNLALFKTPIFLATDETQMKHGCEEEKMSLPGLSEAASLPKVNMSAQFATTETADNQLSLLSASVFHLCFIRGP